LDGTGHEAALSPSVRLEVVRAARADVRLIVPKVAAAVTVSVDGVRAKARWDELPRSHRAGIRAELVENLDALLAPEQQERLELGREEARARRIKIGRAHV